MTRGAVTGRAVGLLVCLDCHAAVKRLDVPHPRCPRCFAHLHVRKPQSIAVTASLLMLASILYIPANVLPVMYTRSIIDDERDTILSGVLVLWQSGDWPIAIVVFVASIVVPLLKIIAMALVLYAAWRPGPALNRLRRSELYRMVEFIGRWSMLDIYAISILVTLVQVQSFATISVGPAAIAFASVVLLTMVAARSFDERLLWDEP